MSPRLTEVTADGLRLVGSRCSSCASVAFPGQGSCPRCASVEVRHELLEPRGTLWTFTIQRFLPPGFDPQHFEPFGVGYVELANGVRVEAILTDVDDLRIGLEMELIPHASAGYAFRRAS